MTNKNNLEKKTEKEEIGNIWKTFIPYTPFGWACVLLDKYINKYHGSTSTSNAVGVSTSLVNLLLTGLYLTFSLGAGTPNFTKWSEINEQRELQMELQIVNQEFQKYQQYQKYDLNKNGVLDSTEFLNYVKKEKK